MSVTLGPGTPNKGGADGGEPPAKKLHPAEDARPRGFDRGLQVVFMTN